MPSTLTCDQVQSNDGIRQITLSAMHPQPSYIYFNVTAEILKAIFSGDVREGDEWSIQAKLINRVGANGKRPSPLLRKV